MYGEKMTGIFKEIKKIFDPKNIFNPGKKVPVDASGGPANGAGTRDYIASHIAIEHEAHHKV